MSDFYKHKNPHRLFRDKENAVLAGVCAGIAEYFGLNRKGVRLVTFLFMLFPPFFAFIVISYVVLTIVLPVKPETLTITLNRLNSGAVSAMPRPMSSAHCGTGSAN